MKRRKPILEILIVLGACAALFLPKQEQLQLYECKTPMDRATGADAEMYKGMELALLERWPEAIAACSRAIELEPGFAVARNNRAFYVTMNPASTREDLEGALADIDLALSLDPPKSPLQESAYRDTRGCVLMKLGRLPEAQTELEISVRLNPTQDHRAHLDQCRALLHGKP